MGNYYLGQNAFDGTYGIDPNKYVISADSMAQIFAELGTVTGMLRNAEQVTYTVTQKDTEELCSRTSSTR